MENNYTIQINLYGEYMTINLPENYDSFKTQISSILGISVEELNLFNIFYKDEDNIQININNIDDYKELIFKISLNEIQILNIEYRNDEKPNNNNQDFYNKPNIDNDIFLNNNLNNNFEEHNSIIFPVMCINCKQNNLKNIIYYCQKCQHYVCEQCFKIIFRNHIHSYNIIGTLEHFNYFNHENENKNNSSNNNINNILNNNSDNNLNNKNDIILDINDNSNYNTQNIDNQINNNENQKKENINDIEKKEIETCNNNNEFLSIDPDKDDWGICPITNEYMENPVITIYGTHYEKNAIIDWLKRHQTDPLTNQPLTEKDLTEDEEYKKNIKEYRFIHDI
jgi:hypothetical protein